MASNKRRRARPVRVTVSAAAPAPGCRPSQARGGTGGAGGWRAMSWATLLTTGGVLLALALVSFHPDDPSFNSAGAVRAVRNWVGPLGSYGADLLYQALGVSALLVPLLMLWRGVVSFRPARKRPIGWRRSLGLLVLAVALAGLAQLAAAGAAGGFQPGGVIGALASGVLAEYLARPGAFIVLVGLLTLALSLAAAELLEPLAALIVRLTSAGGRAALDGVRQAAAAVGQPLPVGATEHGDLTPAPFPAVLDAAGSDPAGEQGVRPLPRAGLQPELAGSTFPPPRAERRGDGGAPSAGPAVTVRGQRVELLPVLIEDPSQPDLPAAHGAWAEPALPASASGLPLAAERRVEPAFVLEDEIDLIREQEYELGDFELDEPLAGRAAAWSAELAAGETLAGPAAASVAPPPTLASNSAAAATARTAQGARRGDAPALVAATALEPATDDAAGGPAELPPPPPAAPVVIQAASGPARVLPAGPVPEPVPEIIDLQQGAAKEELEQLAEEIEKHARGAVDDAAYELPPLTFLDYEEPAHIEVDRAKLQQSSARLLETLGSYGITGHIREIRLGPVVTMFEFVPAPGIKLSKISSLADDLAMSMAALRVRIVAPIPGKGAVGIEIPNENRQLVYLKEVIAAKEFQESASPLTLCLGKDIEGNPVVSDLRKMPHLLIAGATGTGKSVGINSMLISILYKASPRDVRLLMVDPKQLELSVYEGIPHLLLPVVTDPRKAAQALCWAVEEMERRYTTLAELGVRDIDGYNRKVEKLPAGQRVNAEGLALEHLPHLVILIDEFADLMMVASREVETYVARLAQKARAAGIHLILATQRPSVDVITGVIKANFPARLSFQVASKHDARTILDTVGSEHLLGKGDMLFMPPGSYGLRRIHGTLVTETEIERVVDFLKQQGTPQYDESILAAEPDEGLELDDEPVDENYDKAVAFAAEKRKVSVSLLQRYLRIGYNRAARIVERMEREGMVGPADGAKPREVLLPREGGGIDG